MIIIQAFILTYNRPLMVVNAIRSALNQDFNSFEIIVSDNSTNDETQLILSSQEFSNIIYRKRVPSLSPSDHFNLVLSEVNSEFFMIFHDDDVMLPNMISTLYNHFLNSNQNNVVAIGANAYLAENYTISSKLFRQCIKENIIIHNPTELSTLYLKKNSIVPFNSYLYKKQISKVIKADVNKGGKYCDVAFLMDISNLGKVINLESPLMIVNQHPSQDSNINSFYDKLKLINYITNNTQLSRRNKLLKRYRLYNIYAEYSNNLQFGFNLFRYLNFCFILVKHLNIEIFFKYNFRVLMNAFSAKSRKIIL